MSTEDPDPAETIAHALSRLRGRRMPGAVSHDHHNPHEHGHGHGGPHGDHGHGGPHGDHGHGGPHGDHGHSQGHRAVHRTPPWAGGPAGPGVSLGGPAWIRMLDALVTASEPLSVSALGEAIGVDQPRASRLVQQGVQRGIVQREADPDDARRTRIAATEEGLRIAQGMRSERREALSKALESFTADESRELARLLGKLADNWT